MGEATQTIFPMRCLQTSMCLARSACVPAESLQSCPTLCDPVDCSPSGSSIHAMLQARILECVAMPSSRGSSHPRDGTQSLMSPALAGVFFNTSSLIFLLNLPSIPEFYFCIFRILTNSACCSLREILMS